MQLSQAMVEIILQFSRFSEVVEVPNPINIYAEIYTLGQLDQKEAKRACQVLSQFMLHIVF